MRQFGLGKFFLVGVGMLILITLTFDLLRIIYRFLFGSSVPPALIFFLIGVFIFVCAVSFAYRYAYEGQEENQPTLYPQISTKLEMASFVAFFCALVLIWYSTTQWWGWAWVAVYFWGVIRIASVAEKRLLALRVREAKIWFPDMTPAEQLERATAWARSGMEPAEYELQRGRSMK